MRINIDCVNLLKIFLVLNEIKICVNNWKTEGGNDNTKKRMDKSELRNRKAPLKNNLLKKSSTDSEEVECKNERVERLQSEERIDQENSDDGIKGNKKDNVKHSFQTTFNSVVQCLKTDFRFNTDDCLRITFEFDFVTVALFVVAFWTRIYKLSQPNNVV